MEDDAVSVLASVVPSKGNRMVRAAFVAAFSN